MFQSMNMLDHQYDSLLIILLGDCYDVQYHFSWGLLERQLHSKNSEMKIDFNTGIGHIGIIAHKAL